ncbi:PD-(D/E)XK nuclease family protein [Croceitalea sp. P059]|uniref:PD-(D/E)XK nuclease family protein n=1 Tax=Croceitalea sp. P059 TaxID=3075601 RepID=UPI0028851287|nr:PD-(D/E)XK nuclease family protein [Croceitalea sp. P059]MDT0538566.1 PD-(D/E)XK nuclease family protein [Croceitalea sp. P059]
MSAFLKYVVQNTYNKYGSFENLVFVVPSVRSSTYLKAHIAELIESPIFSPTILSIEHFIQEISQLNKTSNTELLFRLYSIYLNSELKEKDDFFSFTRWGQTLLSDFDELDRYLIDTKSIFDYLTALNKLNAWGGKDGLTTMVTDYVKFTQTFKYLYDEFTSHLLSTKDSYQGLRYKLAYSKIHSYISQTSKKSHVFVGFNALNKSEEYIVQKILATSTSEIYWDIDSYFLNDPLHDASYFIKRHKKNWPYLSGKKLQGVQSNFLENKNIEIIGIPKNISQAKYIGSLISNIYSSNTQNKPIALVLADETLLPAILNSIPEEVKEINITMGYPLSDTSISNFFTVLIDSYINIINNKWYYKDILRILSNPIAVNLLNKESDFTANIINKILKNNYTYLTPEELRLLTDYDNDNFNLIFPIHKLNSKEFITRSQQIITLLQTSYNQTHQLIELESLQLYHNLFNQLNKYVAEQEYLNELKTLKSILLELIAEEQLNFQGSTTDGLQIMGMLESRTLDFETVIMSSVNEDILPAGKSNNSFIPFDVKKEYNMPTFKDKDAVYTYHFYRLLQRAKDVYLTYNTEPDVLEGGEKSRFIHQLLTDANLKNFVKHKIAVQNSMPNPIEEKTIEKTPKLIDEIKVICSFGLSPTSLTNYIKNPYGFYKKHILKIREQQQVEETIAHNTFGTIIHDVLEALYTPLIGQYLNKTILEQTKTKINSTVQEHFKRTYSDRNVDKGQNFIVLKVITKYIESVIQFEINQIEKHQIKILSLEQELKVILDIPELDYPVNLKGKLDRIDEIDGQLRILDYKTGKVTKSEVEIFSFDELTSDDKKAKAFQLLCYSLLSQNSKPIVSGILPVKNLNLGILSFAKKSNSKPITKDHLITDVVLNEFKSELKRLILEIADPKTPFKEVLL